MTIYIPKASPQELAQLTNKEYAKVFNKLFHSPIPFEKVFSRMCALQPNSYGDDIKKVNEEYNRIYDKDIKFELILNEDHDPESHYHSTRICYKLLQTGFKADSKYKNPKTNTFGLCPFCDFKPPSSDKDKKHKPHPVIIKIGPNQYEEADSKVEGFYDTGQSALAHHLANCHGVLKKSLMPQPFVGFSKSLSKDNTYKPALVCPHQHWNEEKKLIGCNSVFPYQVDEEIPFKAFFRHFSEYHVSVPKTDVQKEAYARKLQKLAKEPKHNQSPDNLFVQLDCKALNETHNYQKKNARDNIWYETLETIEHSMIETISHRCLKNHESFYPMTKKDEPLISHEAISRSRRNSSSNSKDGSGGSSDKESSETSPSRKISPVQQLEDQLSDIAAKQSQESYDHGKTATASKITTANRVNKPQHSRQRETTLKPAAQNQLAEDVVRRQVPAENNPVNVQEEAADVLRNGCIDPKALSYPQYQYQTNYQDQNSLPATNTQYQTNPQDILLRLQATNQQSRNNDQFQLALPTTNEQSQTNNQFQLALPATNQQSQTNDQFQLALPATETSEDLPGGNSHPIEEPSSDDNDLDSLFEEVENEATAKAMTDDQNVNEESDNAEKPSTDPQLTGMEDYIYFPDEENVQDSEVPDAPKDENNAGSSKDHGMDIYINYSGEEIGEDTKAADATEENAGTSNDDKMEIDNVEDNVTSDNKQAEEQAEEQAENGVPIDGNEWQGIDAFDLDDTINWLNQYLED